jgi:hypothetical protein
MVLITRKRSAVVWVVAVVSGSGIGIAYSSLHIASQSITASARVETDGIDKITTGIVTDPTSIVANTAFSHLLGATFGVSISFSIFQNQFLANLTKSSFSPLAHLYATDAIALVTRVPTGEDGTNVARMVDAYVGSLRTVWIVLAVFAGVALVASLGMKEREITQEVTVLIKLDEAYIV